MRSVRFFLNKELDKFMVIQFLDESGGGVDFGKNIIKTHPSLKLAKDDAGARKRLVESYFEKYYSDHRHEISKKVVQIKKSWERVENRFVKTTEKIFEGYEFPGGRYIAYASIIDCNPRFLDSKTFQFFYKKSVADAVHTIAHELLHFIFFDFVSKKIKKETEKLSAEKLWDLSEIFNVVTLRSPAYRGIVDHKCVRPYPNHKKYLGKFETVYHNSKDLKSFIRAGINILEK